MVANLREHHPGTVDYIDQPLSGIGQLLYAVNQDVHLNRFGPLRPCTFCLVGTDEWNVDEVLGNEPGFELIGS